MNVTQELLNLRKNFEGAWDDVVDYVRSLEKTIDEQQDLITSYEEKEQDS